VRFVRFNAVGVVGFLLQMAVLWLLVRAGVHYLLATALAVECAVLHNFLWHERWTWKDRPATGRVRLGRLARFHALNGMVSLIGNLMLMRGLVGVLGMPVLAANLIAVSICALVNFAASERAVFRRTAKDAASERRERATQTERAGEAASESACRGV
jgi:dolichol-phosphate mannosyltransferase